MNASTIFWYVLLIIICEYIFDKLAYYVNAKFLGRIVPDISQDLYDKKEYVKAQKYNEEINKLGFVFGILNFVIIPLVLYNNGLEKLEVIISEFAESYILKIVYFVVVISVWFMLFSFPYLIYKTSVIDKQFSLNKVILPNFVLICIKSFFLAVFVVGFYFY